MPTLTDSVTRGLTFARQYPLFPRVVKLRIAVITTVLGPSATRSTATEFTGFLDDATLGTHGQLAVRTGCMTDFI